MNTKCKTILVATAVILMQSTASAADIKYLVIPTSSSSQTTCDAPDEVVSGGGRCWKNRNLGATWLASSPFDADAYGGYYQWGRLGDGHQNVTSAPATALSHYDVPGHNMFILRQETLTPPADWRIKQNDYLWQGIGGDNNPCPQGFRIPTKAEWITEINSWDSQDTNGAIFSPLHIPKAGYRDNASGDPTFPGALGFYWSSTVSNTKAIYLLISNSNAVFGVSERSQGMSVRCIKD